MKKDHLRILTIGNSFTDSLAEFFPLAVESAGCKLDFFRANFGGCELERHWSYICAEENSEVCRIYNGGRKLKTTLAAGWDIVTIQQASHASWNWDTYCPYAQNIRDYVKTHAPEAEVVIQQTWAYHCYDPRIRPGGEWGFDQTGMHERLTGCYRKLAEILDARLIPSGNAVHCYRERHPYKFADYDTAKISELQWPDLPPMAGDPVGRCFWHKNGDGEMEIAGDYIHLNAFGRYLQACVWFAFLYERSAQEITFVPDMISDRDAAELREIADIVVSKG